MAAKKATFEDAMKRLEKIVLDMENQEIPLEKSLELYKEGAQCVRLCRQMLDNARHELEIWKSGQAESLDEAELEGERP